MSEQPEIKLGKHTLKERNEFVDHKVSKYLERHPNAKRQKARKYAKVKWARKVNSELHKSKHVNKIRVKVVE